MKRLHMVIVLLAALLVFAVSASAEEWGEVREASQNLNVRAQRTPKSEHIVTLAKGQRVRIDFEKDGWVAVFNLNETRRDEKRAIGYANAKYLLPVKVVETPAPQKAASSEKPAETTARQEPVIEEPVGDGELKASVAATPPPDPIKVGIDPSRLPVKITSDKMTYDESGKVVSFVGNVVAEHGQLTLWANKLSAYFSSRDDKKFGADSVDRIIADGNVRAKKGTTEGSCGRLTYFVKTQQLKMEDDPILQDGPNSLTGEVINFHIRENRSEVVGGKDRRVKAIFMTPEKIKGQ